jgi:hypothetical protein
VQEKDLSRRLIDGNPILKGNLESVHQRPLQLLHQRPNSNSFLVRITFSSKLFCENLIKKGRIHLDGFTHLVVKSDQSKEVWHGSKCQNYGHINDFCKSANPVCGKCSQTHATSSCPSSPKDFKCTNSVCTFPLHSIAQNHQVGSGQSRCSISFRGVIMPVNHHNISKASAPQVFPDQP